MRTKQASSSGDAASRVDVVVIGGGPAGAAAGRILAGLGHETVLISGGGGEGPRVCESLPPSCRKPLAAAGLLEAVEDAGFMATGGNTGAWAGEAPQASGFEGGEAGWQVERHRFDAVLRGAAARAGVRVLAGAARNVRPAGTPGDTASLEWEGEGGSGAIVARWLLDCSGRAGLVARRGYRVRQPGPATLAVVGVWEGLDPGVMADPTHTLVESYESGWAWSVPESEDRRHVAVMVDPRASGLSRGAGLEGIYAAELERTVHHRRLLAGAGMRGSVWACAATPYAARRYAGPGVLLVGDAGSFLDPLSSFGVKKALASGWLAAVVVNTALRNPPMAGSATGLFDARERETHGRYAALAAEYYRRAGAYHGHRFWTSRASSVESPGPAELAGTDSSGLLRHPGVPAELARLRSMPRQRLRQAAGVVRTPMPVVRGHQVVLEEHLVATTVPAGIRSIRGVELTGLIDLLPAHDQVPELYEQVRRAQGAVELPDFLGALAVLLALELVTDAEPE
ncbi:MAG TPA: tryptophan 7-halogenase [Longimicrobiaceae bacterium]|nr:tryptophan 7-halogenase [Longimicrobiaceae bacterium]